MYNDNFLQKKLQERKDQNAFRILMTQKGKIDFCSNDYLGIATKHLLEVDKEFDSEKYVSGSKGSRLLAGNYELIETVENEIAAFHQTPAALIFNSGYDANIGLLSSIPQKGDTILYDNLVHASIRDGIRLSFAQAYSFQHNDLDSLEKKLKIGAGNIFVVTETVFSMDGDICPLEEIIQLCEKYGAHLIIDEAHATGIIGDIGEGLAQSKQIHQRVFARMHTFGKALGCHGAVVLGSLSLKDYLINFARSFIYSTALPPIAIQAIRNVYHILPTLEKERQQLKDLILQFNNASLGFEKLASTTAIQGVIVPENTKVKHLATILQQNNLDVRPILSPTVAVGKERLRIILHAFNKAEELGLLINYLR